MILSALYEIFIHFYLFHLNSYNKNFIFFKGNKASCLEITIKKPMNLKKDKVANSIQKN